MPSFQIRISGDDLVFSAGHFIVFGENQCERLHGHTYRVTAEVDGPLDRHQCVVDFLEARKALKEVLVALDHRMLLPTQQAAISVRVHQSEVEAVFGQRRWVFPKEDCCFLPMANTTSESLAQHIGERLMAVLGPTITSVRITVDEGDGAAACRLP